MSAQTTTRGRRREHSEQSLPRASGLQHAGHSLGGRHLVGHPEPVAGHRVLYADGGLSRRWLADAARNGAPGDSHGESIRRNRKERIASPLTRRDDQVLSGATHNRKTRGARAFFVEMTVRRNYAACLCIAPVADAVPRIAFTERSIAAHSRLISAAARPSEKYSRAPSPLPSAIRRSARLVI